MGTDHEHLGARAVIEHALGWWRDGARLLRRRVSTGWADDYERAVAAAVEHLGADGTMTELVAAYFDDSEAIGKEGWLAPLCHPANSRELRYGIVEDTAFWRREQELIAGRWWACMAMHAAGGVAVPVRVTEEVRPRLAASAGSAARRGHGWG